VIGYSCWKYAGGEKNQKRIERTSDCDIAVDGDTITIRETVGVGSFIAFVVQATDSCGNVATTSVEECLIEVVNPKSLK